MAERSRESSDDVLWMLAHGRGMTRRRFLALMVAGGAAAVLAACREEIPTRARSKDGRQPLLSPLVFKDIGPFIDHRRSGLEARLELIDGLLTPTELFFVRNNSRSVNVDLEDWSLSVEGDVEQSLELRFDDLLQLPTRTLVSYLECAGNQRVMFDLLQGRPTEGTQWGRGAVGNAEWQGVSLSDVLTLAGVSKESAGALLIGSDVGSPERGFRRFLPMDKALEQDTIVAYAMNGAPLARDHGFPLRAIVPGWVGASQIKWLSRIVVSEERLRTRNNTTAYVMFGDAYGNDDPEIREQSIKSALAMPWPARLEPGRQMMRGYAHSGYGPIDRVEWSDDHGGHWSLATVGAQHDYSWAPFEFEWTATSGAHEVMTRATDAEGNTQPDTVPFNEKGYLFNQPLPHPISVG
jgi:DMSO/TMAO reductase YedYZ molybdopterin-dependent catalytic subunit